MLPALSYKAKIFLYSATLFAVFTLALVVFQYQRERRFRIELLEARLRSYADIVAAEVRDHGLTADSASYEPMRRLMPAELRTTVIGRDGRVLYESSPASPVGMESHLSRPEVQQALRDGEGQDVRRSATRRDEYFYFAKAYERCLVRVALPYDATVRHFMQTDNLFLWFTLLLFPFVLLVLFYFTDHFGKAIGGLRHFIAAADRGLIDYDRIRFPRSDVGDVGRTILSKYRELDESRRRLALERERLLRHFLYFDGGIAIFQADRTLLYANPHFLQCVNALLDTPVAEFSAACWQAPPFRPADAFLQTEGEPLLRYVQPAGGLFLSVQVLRYSDGGFEMTLADITQSEKTRRLKQQMSNNITHELRTPVSSICGFLETLRSHPELDEERRAHFLERAHLQTLRLSNLIRDVALITKVEEAPESLRSETLNLRSLVDDVIEEMRAPIDAARARVENTLSPDLTLCGNYSLVYSIFRNLFENSLRYGGESLLLHLSCYKSDADFCYFSYYDTGRGVPEAALPRLFERFFRVDEGRTRNNGGTGLGLSIVRNAVLFHHGQITVRNRREGGLEFLFTLQRTP